MHCNRALNYFYLAMGFMLILGCSESEHNKPIENNFEKVFKPYKEIELKTSSFFEIRSLDVSSSQDLLITNRKRTEVFLFDSTGNLKAELAGELDKGFPGANWSPYKAYFTRNNEVFVSNGVPWGIWFNKDGSFKKMMPRTYRGTPDLTFDGKNNIYSLNKNQLGFFISKYDSSGTEKFRITEVDSSFRVIMRRGVVGNNIITTANNLFYKNISKPVIYKYNFEGNLLAEYAETPTYYKGANKDISSLKKSDSQNLVKSVFEFAKKYTANYSLFELDENLLLVQYSNFGGWYGYQILTSEGDYVLEDFDLYSKNKILGAKNGLVYTLSAKDTLPPVLKVFEFSPAAD